MKFYDTVKDAIRKETVRTGPEDGEDAEDGGDEDMGFDQLINDAADQSSAEDENTEAQHGTTPIEVLTEDSLQQETPQEETADAAEAEPSIPETRTTAVAQDEVVAVLRSIEQQNEEMMQILRGIKRSLDR